MIVQGLSFKEGRRRLWLVSQFVTEDAGDVVATFVDQEVDATVVDPTMATVPESSPESNTESLFLDEHEVEPEPAV